VLRGVERFRVIEENHDRTYRRAVYEAAPERSLTADQRGAVTRLRKRLEGLTTTAVETLGRRHLQHAASRGDAPHSTAGLNDEELVNALAQYLDFEPLEKLALLEQNCLKSRADALLELLEMKMMLARTPGAPRVQH
jgi:Lon protease-like protein